MAVRRNLYFVQFLVSCHMLPTCINTCFNMYMYMYVLNIDKCLFQLPEIKTYMDHFPFPFYIILRDINSLPQVLSDALRQWFELVTSVDR